MSEAIQASIREFEPRLQNVRVRMVPRTAESTQLRFDITAEMVAGPNKSKVRFETKLENSGRLSLKE
jgi:type VI secretion system lysozyme-like protein